MTSELIDFDALMRLACKKVVDEEVAFFDSLDVCDTIISPKTTRKFKRTLRIAMFKDSKGYKYFKKTAIACLLIFTLLFAASLTFEPVRAYIWDVLVNFYEDHIEINFINDDSNKPQNTIEKNYIPELPEGWMIESTSETSAEGEYFITTPENKRIIYYQLSITSSLEFDNREHTVREIILKNNRKVYLFTYKDGYKILTWKDSFVFVFQGYDIKDEDLICAAECLK